MVKNKVGKRKHRATPTAKTIKSKAPKRPTRRAVMIEKIATVSVMRKKRVSGMPEMAM